MKPPPVERFRITCEVEVSDLGSTIAQLTKLGLSKINFDLIEEVRAFAKKTYHEVKAADFLTEWLTDHPTFRAREAVKHFKAHGRTAGAAYSAVRDLFDAKVLRRLGEGNYARADIKALAAPKRKKGERKRFSKRGEEVIVSYAKRMHGHFNTAKIVEIFETEGRARASVYPCIDTLIKTKRIKRVGDKGSGQYVMLAKPAPAKKKSPAKKPTNGSSALHVEGA